MSKNNDYYKDDSKKIIDFVIGFFVSTIIVIIGVVATIQYSYILPKIFNLGTISIAFLVLTAAAVIYFMKIKGRRYLGIGIITPLIIFALIFGSCIAAFVPKGL